MAGARHARIVTGLYLTVVLCGCSVVRFETGSAYRDDEGRFSAQLIDQITPGQTTDVWLKQQFGAPIWVDQAPFDVAIYTWQFQRETHKRRELLWVIRHHSVKQEREFLHTVMQRGKVVKHWRDATEHVDVGRVTYALGLDRPPADLAGERSKGIHPEMPDSSAGSKPAGNIFNNQSPSKPASSAATEPRRFDATQTDAPGEPLSVGATAAQDNEQTPAEVSGS